MIRADPVQVSARSSTPAARRRFLVWIAAAAGLFAGQIAWLLLLRGSRVMHHDGILIAGQFALGAVVLLVAWLLGTTPADAIRLRPATSEAIILIGAAALQVAAIVLLRPGLSE